MTILHVDSSITGENSVSRQLTRAVVERLAQDVPPSQRRYRDLAADPLPHFLPGADNPVVEEFLAADTIVVGAPMYNFTVPSQLKAWIDGILVAGRTFRYTEAGPEGLAGPKRVIVVVSRGGLYGAGTQAAAAEHVETYLRTVFAFIGLQPEFLIAEGVQLGPDARAAAIEGALQAVCGLAA
ncbi:MAG TPA: NAD(P)H-dependent oxidoreductase [Sphingobium sp.]|nr:NAD(P)H-dependent oxidoreductase [Sphingobium sp.]